MERMSGIDPMFVYSETPVTPMEVAYACVFDPASVAAVAASLKALGIMDTVPDPKTIYTTKFTPVKI